MAPSEDPEFTQIVRAVETAINSGTVDEMLRWIHPEVEFTSMIAEAEGETFRGHDGVRRWWGSVRNAFETVRWDYETLYPRGRGGVAQIRITGRLSGVDVSQTMWQAVELRDGKGFWWGFFRDEQDAVQAMDARGDTG